MQCIQIRPLLQDYATGELPQFKAAWVVQHLVACAECQTQLAELLAKARQSPGREVPHRIVPARAAPARPSPARVSHRRLHGKAQATPAPDEPAGEFQPVQRAIPRRVRLLRLALALLLVTGLGWLFVKGTLPALAGLPSEAAARPEDEQPVTIGRPTLLTAAPLPARAQPQRQGDVTLVLESVTPDGDSVLARVRFNGENIYPPNVNQWVTVANGRGEAVESRVELLSIGSHSIGVEIEFALPADGQFQLQASHIVKQLLLNWNLSLPQVPAQMELPQKQLGGIPVDITLAHYGLAGDLLCVGLQDTTGTNTVPPLSLRDGAGALYSPVSQLSPGTASTETIFQYAVPKELRLPLRLVGQGWVQRNVGPWRLDVSVTQ